MALSYTLGGIEDLKFFKGAWLGGALGILIARVLSANVLYERSFPEARLITLHRGLTDKRS